MQLLLENSRFRWLWFSGLTNELSIIMYFMAQGWLALTVTDSAFWVGATSGVSGLGLLSFAAIAGVLVDRVDRRRLLVVGQNINLFFRNAAGYLVLFETTGQ